MILNDYDLKILREFCKLGDNECTTTWKIMKKIFKEGGNEENFVIKYRIEKMAKEGLFKINGGKARTYIMNRDKVFYKDFNFPCGRKKGIAILMNSKWEVFQM